MITNKELNAVKLSPTKKDFYQIWNELLDTAGKISERWDPASTNESDPGIVLLKVLTAVADKLNYNIDANTLEAFMPSAAQEESMRKLTEMMGYDMKYYQSATTEVKISYNKNTSDPINGILCIDKFTNIKDIDDSINYVTLESLNLTSDIYFGNVECIEGELVECETDDNNIVSIFHLDDNKRYFLPETQIAENAIFVTNIENNIQGDEWKKVSNLNAQSLGSKVFKFGFDSQEGLPYIQFPEDISTIIEDGLRISYIRTSGANGNISVNTLSKLTTPLSWSSIASDEKAAYHDVTNYTVSNIRAATNGANKEGINAAYNNFKKTIGTFDTLVTCRDYMNKIYNLVSAADNTTPLVSNVIVSDIKDDINRAVTIGTFTSRGIEYKVIAKPGKQLTHFDLIMYPFKSTYGLNSKSEFNKSFKYDNSNYSEILANIEDTKTISHNFLTPNFDELACVKNYYRIRSKINTVRKVGVIEQASILNNIYTKLFENFNMRQLDFGEEIPYDTLLKVIETADPRIKNISLDDPEITTRFLAVDNTEYKLSDTAGKQYYNSLVLNNVLAGRVPLFNYNTNFTTNFKEKDYDQEGYQSIYPGTTAAAQQIYKLKTELEIPVEAVEGVNTLKLTENEVIQFRAPSFKSTVTYPAYVNYYLHLDKTNTRYVQAIPATMQTLGTFLKGGPNATNETAKLAIEHYINNTNFPSNLITQLEINPELRQNEGAFKARFDALAAESCALFVKPSETYVYVEDSTAAWTLLSENENLNFYALVFNKEGANDNGILAWARWLVNISTAYLDHTDSAYDSEDSTNNLITLSSDVRFKGFYKVTGGNLRGNLGYLIDNEGRKFRLVETPKDIAANPFNSYFVPRIWSGIAELTDPTNTNVGANLWHTQNGLGQDAVPFELTKGIEYELRPNEYLLINYTQSQSDNSEIKEDVYKVYSSGTIIKPNFAIADSEDWYNSNHAYTKHNVTFEEYSNVTSMFTLGTDEQIEIREVIQVEIAEQNANLYWEIPNLVSTQGGYLEFPWDEEPINKNTGNPWRVEDGEANKMYSAYTLKEGEYLYYTDMNKSDIAFYGFGSTIRRKHNTPTIFKYVSDDVVSSEDISTMGLSAAIPWRNYNFQDYGSLSITENQFINLTEGDKLIDIKLDADESSIINNDYKDVVSASYSFATEDDGTEVSTSLPPLSLTNSNFKWQVRSKLNLSLSPLTSQTLKTKNINGHSDKKVIDRLTLINTTTNLEGVATDSTIKVLEAVSPSYPLSIKANKLIQSAVTVTDVTNKELSEDGILETIIPDLQLKLFETTEVRSSVQKTINIGNFGNGKFTAINFEEQAVQGNITDNTTSITIPLEILIPEDSFGLLMIYYENLDNTNTNRATVTCTTPNNIGLFNRTGSWDGTLNYGINVIKINQSDSLTISANGNNKALITFGNLDLVYKDNSINPKLCYKAITESNAYEQILADITSIDTNNYFYYNMPIAGNLDIDMNNNDEQDTLENPLNWFSYNNINNKFVISVIDTEHLADDIIIAKSSRSNF